MAALTDEESAGEDRRVQGAPCQGETLDQLLPEAFAVVRETGKRVLGMRHSMCR